MEIYNRINDILRAEIAGKLINFRSGNNTYIIGVAELKCNFLFRDLRDDKISNQFANSSENGRRG